MIFWKIEANKEKLFIEKGNDIQAIGELEMISDQDEKISNLIQKSADFDIQMITVGSQIEVFAENYEKIEPNSESRKLSSGDHNLKPGEEKMVLPDISIDKIFEREDFKWNGHEEDDIDTEVESDEDESLKDDLQLSNGKVEMNAVDKEKKRFQSQQLESKEKNELKVTQEENDGAQSAQSVNEGQDVVVTGSRADNEKSNEEMMTGGNPEILAQWMPNEIGCHDCPICGRQFANTSAKTQHIPSHDPEPSFKCSTCDRLFQLKNSLTRHCRVKKHKPSEA